MRFGLASTSLSPSPVAIAIFSLRNLSLRRSINRYDILLSRMRIRVPASQSNKALAFSLEVFMKKFFLRPLMIVALVLGVSLPVLADTIHLKDGSVIRVLSFCLSLKDIAARGRKSRVTVYMEDVESIEFDSAGTAGANEDITTNTNTSTPNTQPTNTQPSYTPPGRTTTNTGAPPTFFQINVRVRADNTSNGWTNTGLVVRRGQRLKINASGRVSLGNNRATTADGLPNVPDRDKLMRNQPTGGLIAVIGDDNDDFIFVGRSRDFVAQRDGVLFLGVNEGNLSDNSGLFEVTIEAETMGGNPR